MKIPFWLSKVFRLSFFITLRLTLIVNSRVEQIIPGATSFVLVAGCEINFIVAHQFGQGNSFALVQQNLRKAKQKEKVTAYGTNTKKQMVEYLIFEVYTDIIHSVGT